MDDFVKESERARALVAAGLRELWSEWQPTATLELAEPTAPLAPMGSVRAQDGRLLAEFSAHAHAMNVLIGEEALLCAFDEGTTEQRAERLVGAVAALVRQAEPA